MTNNLDTWFHAIVRNALLWISKVGDRDDDDDDDDDDEDDDNDADDDDDDDDDDGLQTPTHFISPCAQSRTLS